MTSLGTVGHQLWCDNFECLLNVLLHVEVLVVRNRVQSRLVEQSLHVAEAGFYRVQVRSVRDILDSSDVELPVKLGRVSAVMNE